MNQPVTLIRDCSATIIPAGDEVVLPEGGSFVVAQALGGSVTLRDATGMFRVGNENLDALGEDIKAAVDAGADAVAAGAFFVFHGPHRAVLITYPDYNELEDLLST